jgi:hypothetical protein
LGALGRCLAI